MSYGPDYREVYTKEEMEKFNIRCLMAAILEGNGIDRGMAVREAFFITDDVKNLSQLRIEDRLKAQEKHARGY